MFSLRYLLILFFSSLFLSCVYERLEQKEEKRVFNSQLQELETKGFDLSSLADEDLIATSFYNDPISGLYFSGKSGLYKATSDGLETLVNKNYHSILPWSDSSLILCNENGVEIWRNQVYALEISDLLQNETVLSCSLASSDSFWILTAKALYIFENDKLKEIGDFGNAEKLFSSQSHNSLVIENKDKSFVRLKKDEKGNWQIQNIDQGPDKFLPFFDLQAIYLSSGKVFIQSPKNDDTLAEVNEIGLFGTNVQKIFLDSGSGNVWVLTSDSIFVIDKALSIKKTSINNKSLESQNALSVSSFGALWFYQSGKLSGIGNFELIPSYETNIQPFMNNNCVRCHTNEGGLSFPLETYEQVSGKVSMIIDSIASGRMPPDGRELIGGDESLFERWRDGGLEK